MTPPRFDQVQVFPELTKMLTFPCIATLVVRHIQQPRGNKLIKREGHRGHRTKIHPEPTDADADAVNGARLGSGLP
jgi:hypothetical protein